MKSKVVVIDYGLGNIFSITNALLYLDAEMLLTDSPWEVADSEKLILPGVGAFQDGMKALHKRGLDDAIQEFVQKNRPFLGICLGMQMMMDVSEEFGECKGLGLISGRVVSIPSDSIDGISHKIPHIGWNSIEKPEKDTNWDNTILHNILPSTNVYFVHSYTAVPDTEEHCIADTFYNGRRLSSVVAKGHLYGCQFHPEKSGEQGLKILRNFLEL